MCNNLMSFGFGEMSHDGLITRTGVRFDDRADLPESFSKHLMKWRSWAKSEKMPIYYIKLAHIDFGYRGKHYSLGPGSLQVDDARFECVAGKILKEMEQLGCDYGAYYGFMD